MSVLESELSDTLSLDYQRSSHPTQYPTKFLDIALDISPRLATLASHIPPHLSTPKTQLNLPLGCVIVAYLAQTFKSFYNTIYIEKSLCLKQRTAIPYDKNLYCLKQRKEAITSFPEIDKKIDFVHAICYNSNKQNK